MRQFLFILPPTAMKLCEPFAISKKPLVGPIVLHKDAKTKLTPPQTLPILVYLVQRRMSHPVFQNTIVLNHRKFLERESGIFVSDSREITSRLARPTTPCPKACTSITPSQRPLRHPTHCLQETRHARVTFSIFPI